MTSALPPMVSVQESGNVLPIPKMHARWRNWLTATAGARQCGRDSQPRLGRSTLPRGRGMSVLEARHADARPRMLGPQCNRLATSARTVVRRCRQSLETLRRAIPFRDCAPSAHCRKAFWIFGGMQTMVRSTVRQQFQILWSIVAAIAVAMMHYFVRGEIASDLALHHESMLTHIAEYIGAWVFRHPNENVPVRANDSPGVFSRLNSQSAHGVLNSAFGAEQFRCDLTRREAVGPVALPQIAVRQQVPPHARILRHAMTLRTTESTRINTRVMREPLSANLARRRPKLIHGYTT